MNNNLNSTIPSTLGQLTNLTTLMLTLNRLHGTIPRELSAVPNLRTIALDNNWLYGSLPPEFGYAWGDLTTLILAGNQLSGSIPDIVSIAFPHLKIIHIEKNSFTGMLPSFTPQYTPKLSILALGSNLFHGSIPSEYGLLPEIQSILIDVNMLSGTLPDSLGTSTSLNFFNCSHNQHLDGTLDVFFSNPSSVLRALFIDHNQFTGSPFPTYSNHNGNESLQQLLLYDVYTNFLTGLFSSQPFGSPELLYLDVGSNFLSQTLPSWVGYAQNLTYLFVNGNMFHGSIPNELGMYSKSMLVLFMQHNRLSNTIPSSIGEYPDLLQFKAHNNRLHGTIPNTFSSCKNLATLTLNNNMLDGTLPNFINATRLETLDLSSNKLTGEIPFNIFKSKVLNTVILSDNCLEESLDEEICEASNLINLSLDGMGTAKVCQQNIFPHIPYFNAFIALDDHTATLPGCIFEMDSLTTLYLAGTQMVGTIPNIAAKGKSLSELSLSYNSLTGTIPMWIQHAKWNSLSLSNNKLSGGLNSHFFEQSRSSYISLEVNRLSGSVPNALVKMNNVSILAGNIFECNFIKSNIPKHDRAYRDYSCGSNAIDRSIYTWMLIYFFTFFIAGWMMVWFSKAYLQDSRETHAVMTQHDVEHMSYWFHIHRTARYLFSIVYQAKREWKQKHPFKLKTLDDHNSIFKMFSLFATVRNLFAYITIITFILMMPMFITLSIWYSTYVHSYAWVISGVFLSGAVPSAFLACSFMFILWFVWNFFHEKVYRFSARKLQDKLQKGIVYNEQDRSMKSSLGSNSNDTPRLSSMKRRASSILSDSYVWLSSQTDRLNIYSKYYTKENVIYRLSTIICGLINFVTLISASMLYVIYSMKVDTRTNIILQITLSIFKVGWNETILWRLYPNINKVCTRIVYWFQQIDCRNICIWSTVIPPRPIYTNSENDHESGKPLRNRTSSDDSWMNKQKHYQYSTDELNFMVFTVIFNNVIIPCIAIAVVSPHCFYDAFFLKEPTEQVDINTCQFYRIENNLNIESNDCFFETNYEYNVQYDLPFHYRYECSAAFSMKFVSVYIFMFAIVGIGIPFLILCLQYLYNKYDPYSQLAIIGEGRRILTKNEMKIFKIVDYLLPNRWKAITPKPPRDLDKFRLLSNDRLVVRFSSYFAILLAFGVLFPPLALVAVVSIYSITYFEQFSISRLLVESKALNYVWYQEKILKECEYIAESWFDTLKIILPFASFSYSFVVLDTLGDQYGWKGAIGPALFVFLLPWFFFAFDEIVRKRLGWKFTSCSLDSFKVTPKSKLVKKWFAVDEVDVVIENGNKMDPSDDSGFEVKAESQETMKSEVKSPPLPCDVEMTEIRTSRNHSKISDGDSIEIKNPIRNVD